VLERTVHSEGLTTQARTGGLYSLSGVLMAVGIYSVIHVAARLVASLNLGEDDPLDAILAQTLQLGYLPGQPPLYDWAIWALGELTGPGAFRFQLLKYALLTATCAFIFLSARRVMKGDVFWAFISVEALALIYQISWRFHEGFTHQVGAMCAVAATFWALLRLIERGRLADFALLGAIAGLGVLTEPIYWVFLAVLIISAYLQPAIGTALFRPALAFSFVVMTAIAAPHYIWLAATEAGLGAILPSLADVASGDYFRDTLAGARRAFTEPLMYLAPLIFILPIFFPGMVMTVWRDVRLAPNRAAQPDLEQLILHMSLLSVLALIIGAVVFGIKSYPTHALMPLFLISSIWLVANARNAAPPPGQIRRFVIMAVGIAIVAFFGRAANMYIQHPVCKICRWGVPYAELSEAMKSRGFSGGEIVVNDPEIGGNLHRFFPNSRISLSGSHPYQPPAVAFPERPRQSAILWPANQPAERAAADLRKLYPGLTVELLNTAEVLTFPWSGWNLYAYGNPEASWRVLLLPGDLSQFLPE
jgi:hypothetical protein